MENDKENMHRVKVVTRIPVPIAPLPPIPMHLLDKQNEEKEQIGRFPLRTLSHVNTNTASTSKNPKNLATSSKQVPARVFNIDSRNVTVRRKNESLDWNYNGLKDLDMDIISSDEDEQKDTMPRNKSKMYLGESRLAVTPAIQQIEHKGVRNIKKSLKRPHSRELQGIATVSKEHKADERVKRRLQFQETVDERLKSPDVWKKSYMTCLARDYTEDMFEYLLTVEQKTLDVPKLSCYARACIVNWLMKVNGSDGNPAIVQSACWYFDSILGATRAIRVNKLQLLAAACYWIAQKLHGPVAPALRLVKCSSYAFSADKLLEAEMAVLKRLKFPQQPVIPQEFITYLSWWCDQVHPGEIEVAATFLCMSGLMATKALCAEYPSVIAVTAVKTAVILLRKREYLVRLQLCPIYRAAEKKASSLSNVSSIFLQALQTITHPKYEYKTPLEHYGIPPHCVAQKIVHAAVLDGLQLC